MGHSCVAVAAAVAFAFIQSDGRNGRCSFSSVVLVPRVQHRSNTGECRGSYRMQDHGDRLVQLHSRTVHPSIERSTSDGRTWRENRNRQEYVQRSPKIQLRTFASRESNGEWRVYVNIPAWHPVTDHQLGYHHSTVNHSQFFVDPATGANTQRIEANWGHVKTHICQRMKSPFTVNSQFVAPPKRAFHVNSPLFVNSNGPLKVN